MSGSNVRFVPIADIALRPGDVLQRNSACPLSANSGHHLLLEIIFHQASAKGRHHMNVGSG